MVAVVLSLCSFSTDVEVVPADHEEAPGSQPTSGSAATDARCEGRVIWCKSCEFKQCKTDLSTDLVVPLRIDVVRPTMPGNHVHGNGLPATFVPGRRNVCEGYWAANES